VLDRLNYFFEKELKKTTLEPILVGVSGGPDSVCLLDLLVRSGRKVVAAHFDHQLREDSSKEAEFVTKIVANYGIPFFTESGDVGSFAKENGFSLEEAARKARYRFLFSKAREFSAGCIAVAHNADDQVETILMHFTRGAGLNGLKGMTPFTILPEFDSEIPLIRPLLHIWRIEILEYCRNHDLKFVQDPSNLDQTYFRNYMRHDLIPGLESRNPGIKNTLLKSAASLAGDYELIRELVDQYWTQVMVAEGKDYLSFDLSLMRSSSVPLLRNTLRRAVDRLKPSNRDFDFDAVERGVTFISTNYAVSSRIDLVEGLQVFGIGNLLYVAYKDAKIPLNAYPQIRKSFEITPQQVLDLGDGWLLRTRQISRDCLPSGYNQNQDSFIAWLDASKVTLPLKIRGRQKGDRFKPLGMVTGSIKLSDIFINEKIPHEVRANWPLICMGDDIIWVPGYRSGEEYKVAEKTRIVIEISIIQQS
jgi:tRNA(Ile)-lysidine synthase